DVAGAAQRHHGAGRRAARARSAGVGRPRPPARAQAGRAVRRRAPARGGGARPGQPPGLRARRRAHRQPRREDRGARVRADARAQRRAPHQPGDGHPRPRPGAAARARAGTARRQAARDLARRPVGAPLLHQIPVLPTATAASRCHAVAMPSAPPPAPFGPAAAAALVSGVAACLQLPSLPGTWLFAALLPAGLLAWALRWRGRLLGPLLCGVALAGLHAGYVLGARLPAALEGRELEVAGTVLELPRRDAARVRFRFRVDEAPAGTEALRGKLLQLSWYFDGDDRVSLAPGERWRLRLKLRAPHALRNPGTRDGERRALAERIAATGYVRDPGLARRLSPARGIDAWRDRMGERIAATVDAGASRFVRALALGDTRALDTADWQVLRAT